MYSVHITHISYNLPEWLRAAIKPNAALSGNSLFCLPLSVFLVGISTARRFPPLCALSQLYRIFILRRECENRWQSLGSAKSKARTGHKGEAPEEKDVTLRQFPSNALRHSRAEEYVAVRSRLLSHRPNNSVRTSFVFSRSASEAFFTLVREFEPQQDIQYWSRLQPHVLRPDSFFKPYEF